MNETSVNAVKAALLASQPALEALSPYQSPEAESSLTQRELTDVITQ